MERWTIPIVCASLAFAAPVRAQDQTPDALVAEGLRLRQEGRDQEAAERFERAHELDGSPRALAQLALAEQALGRWVRAEAHLTEALARGDDPWISGHRAVLTTAIETIRRNVGQLAVDANVEGAAIAVNGRAVGTAPLAPVTVEIGTAVVEITAPGYVPLQRSASVRAASLTRMRVDLVQEARPASSAEDTIASSSTRPTTPLRPLTEPAEPSPLLWVGIGSAAGAVIVLAATLVAVGVRESHVQEWNDDSRCDPSSPMGRLTNCADVYSTWRTAEDWMIAGFVTTGVLAVTGAVLTALGASITAERGATSGLRLDRMGLRLIW